MKENSKLYCLPPRERSLGYLVNWAARLYAREMDAALRPLGLTSAQLPIFFALADGCARTQRDLARLAAVEQPTMANTLTRMARDGLIERRPNPADARSSLIALTPAADALLSAVAAAVESINTKSRSALTQAEGTALESLLLKVVAGLQEGDG